MEHLTAFIRFLLDYLITHSNVWKGKVEDATKVQTLLFSATLPDWVNKVRSFYKSGRVATNVELNNQKEASVLAGFIINLPKFWLR
jgi:superfamily II DNA/RNA helicase